MSWIDKFASHAPSEPSHADSLLEILEKFINICTSHNLVISLPRYTFYEPEIKWYGRLFESSRVHINPSSHNGMVNTSEPEFEGEFCEYIHGVAWMSNAIPRLTERSAPLCEVLEVAYRMYGKRTKKSMTLIFVYKTGCGAEHSDAFMHFQEQL